MPAEAASISESTSLLPAFSDGIARLTLNRPQHYNALSAGLMAELQDCLDQIAEDPSVRAVIIEGAGKGFCAGHDLKELRGHSGDRHFFQKAFRQCSKLMITLTTLPQPAAVAMPWTLAMTGCGSVVSVIISLLHCRKAC